MIIAYTSGGFHSVPLDQVCGRGEGGDHQVVEDHVGIRFILKHV